LPELIWPSAAIFLCAGSAISQCYSNVQPHHTNVVIRKGPRRMSRGRHPRGRFEVARYLAGVAP
jgi:hypothetical protein